MYTPPAVVHRRPSLARWALAAVLVTLMVVARDAAAGPVTFGPGSLIIPMDTGNPGIDDGQDSEILRAYGLVYALLRAGVPVHWAIDPDKPANGDDFTIPNGAGFSVQSVRNNAAVQLPRAYRGGPFVVAAADAPAALPLIAAWQAMAFDETEVHHLVEGSFTPDDVPRTLRRAPRLAVLRDGNEQIAFNDLNAAGIPDSAGSGWASTSPDLLTETDVAGPSQATAGDGALVYASNGLPRYCHLTAMHYNLTALTPGVVREVRSWLAQGALTHAFMQCLSTTVFENDAASGAFLTTGGIEDDGDATDTPANRFPSDPLSQIDGTFSVDSGAIDSIRLRAASAMKTGVRTLFNDPASALTARITMLAGRLDGVGPTPSTGRVTYLAGHDYSVDLPVSANPQTNGVRLMMNTIFESDCATDADPAPQMDGVLVMSGPATITGSQITYSVSYTNPGPRTVENVTLTDALPPGTTYATGSAVPAPTSTTGGVLTWHLPPIASGASVTVTFNVNVPADGTYINDAELSFSHLTVRTILSNTVTTVRDTVAPNVMIIAGPSGLTNDSTPTFEFVNADNTAVVMECRIAPSAFFAACSESPASFTAALSSGNYTFIVRVTDAAGNQATASRAFEVDVDPPHVDFAAAANPIYTNSTRPSFAFQTFGGLVTTDCRVSPTTPPRSFGTCFSPWQVPIPDLPDGTYVVEVRPTDAAGNVGPIASHSFTVDTVAPVVQLSPANPTVTDATPAFSWTVSPGGSPVTTQCRIDDGSWEPCTSAYVVPTALADGPHTFHVDAVDAAGNHGMVVSHPFLVDTVAPVVTIPGPPLNPTVTDDPFPSFVFGVSGGGSPVHAQCRIILFGSAVPVPYQSCDLLTFTHPGPSPLVDGNYIFEVLASDDAGNFATAELPFSFTVDTVGPVVMIFAPPSNSLYTNDRTPDFGFSVSNGGSPTAVDCRVTNITPALSTDTGVIGCASRWPVPVSLADGKYRLVVRATDGIPQVGTDSFDFIVDTTAPQVTLSAANPPVVAVNTPTFNFSVSGGLDTAPSHALCRIDDGGFTPCTTATSHTVAPPLTDGMHIFAVVAFDDAGNTGAVVSHPFVVDTTPATGNEPPTATAPAVVITTEDTVLAFVGGNQLTVDDVDSSILAVTVVASNGNLTLGTAAGLTFTIGDGAADAVMAFSGTLAALNTALATLSYAPTADYNGAAALTFTAFDGEASVVKAVTLTITPVADITGDAVSTSEDAPITFNVITGTNGATADHFENAPSVTGVSQGLHGAVTFGADGLLTYAPDSGFDGMETFMYTVTSGGVTEMAMVTVTVVARTLVAIDVTPVAPTVAAGATRQFTATGIFSDGSTEDLTATATWSSSTTAVATISNAVGSKGVATGVAAGMTEIRATASDVAGSTTLTVTPAPAGVLCPREPLVCKSAGVTTLNIRNRAADRADKMKFTWTRGDATTASDIGNPSVDTNYAVCVWDHVGGAPTLVMEMLAAAGGNCVGHQCWRPVGNGGFRYKDPGLVPHGLQQLSVTAGTLGQPKVLVKARGALMPDPPMPFQHAPLITVQVINDLGSCWGADYVNAPRVNTAEKLIAKEKP